MLLTAAKRSTNLVLQILKIVSLPLYCMQAEPSQAARLEIFMVERMMKTWATCLD